MRNPVPNARPATEIRPTALVSSATRFTNQGSNPSPGDAPGTFPRIMATEDLLGSAIPPFASIQPGLPELPNPIKLSRFNNIPHFASTRDRCRCGVLDVRTCAQGACHFQGHWLEMDCRADCYIGIGNLDVTRRHRAEVPQLLKGPQTGFGEIADPELNS